MVTTTGKGTEKKTKKKTDKESPDTETAKDNGGASKTGSKEKSANPSLLIMGKGSKSKAGDLGTTEDPKQGSKEASKSTSKDSPNEGLKDDSKEGSKLGSKQDSKELSKKGSKGANDLGVLEVPDDEPPRAQALSPAKSAPLASRGATSSNSALKQSGMKIISQIPDRIKSVERILALESFNSADLSSMFQDLSNVKGPLMGFPLAALMGGGGGGPGGQEPGSQDAAQEEEDETVGTNPKMDEMFSVLRPLLSQVTTDVGALRLMMSSQIAEVSPEDIQDDDTGQQIMIVLSVLNKVEEFPKREFEVWSQYHLLRNEMVLKLNPTHKNTFQAIHDLDCKIIMHLRSTAYKLMETYMTLHTMVEETVKRLQKIDNTNGPKKTRLYKSMYN